MFRVAYTGWRAAAGGAIFGSLILVLGSCSSLEKSLTTSSPDGVSDAVVAADLTARFPAPAASRPKEATAPRSQVFPGSADDGGSGAPSSEEPVVDRGSDGFDLNFQNADVGAVTKVLMGDLLKLNYSLDPRVQGTMSLSSGRPIPKAALLPMFESALKLVNANVVHEGSIYKIVPTGEALGNGVVDRNTASTPGYGISVLPLRFVSAETVLRAIDSFAAKPGMARVDNARNLLLVQGQSTERASAIEAALALDVDWMKNQSVGIFPVRNASPDTIIAELKNVFDSSKEGAAGNLVRFQPINRLNAVLAIAKTNSMITQVRTWVARLDRADYDNTTVRVYRLRYGNARVVAGILKEVFTGQAGSTTERADLSQLTPGSTMQRATNTGTSAGQTSSSGSGSSVFGTNTGDNPPGGSQRGGQTQGPAVKPGTDIAALSNTSGSGGPAVLPNVRITADVANNSLLIFASRDQYKMVERAIFELDRAPLQVAIDVTVAEITLNDTLKYGVQFFLKGSANGNQGSVGFGLDSVLKRTIPGANLVLGGANDPRVILSALRAITDVKVISSPALVVLDNQQAILQVGDQIPVTTRQASDVVVPNAPIVSSVEMRDTGVILKVIPRVNANGVVNLDVTQEVSAAQPQTDPTLTPTISQRRVQSSIAVASGQTVLLGGLISSKTDNGRSGIPILSDIKGIGDLFANTTKTNNRTELIIFIRPQIIRDGIDAQLVAEELRSKLTTLGRGSAPARPRTPAAAVAR
jgi:general secretion pathway protein D